MGFTSDETDLLRRVVPSREVEFQDPTRFDAYNAFFYVFLHGTEEEQTYALRMLSSEPLERQSQVWFIDNGCVSCLIRYASQSRVSPVSRELALRLLMSVTFELSVGLPYPTDLGNNHFQQLGSILRKYPANAFHILWILYELTKFELGRRGVMGAGIHDTLGKIVLSQVNSRIIAAALYLLCDLAGDEACVDTLIKLNVFRMFRVSLHHYLSRNVFNADFYTISQDSKDIRFMWRFVTCDGNQRMKFQDVDLVAAYYRLNKSLPIAWIEVKKPWFELILTLVQHPTVIERAAHLGQYVFVCLKSVLLLATDGNVMRLIEIVSNLVQARHEEALKWIFNKGLIKIILLRYPWRKFTDCPSNTQQIMEEVLLLILKVFDTLPHTIYAQYESPEKLRLDYELDTVFHIQWPNRIKDSLTNICTHLNLVISD